MKSFYTFALVTTVVGFASCQNIIEIQTKTDDDFSSDMDRGSLDIQIINSDIDQCIINDLSSGDNDFESGEVDSFIEDDLDACYNFPLPGGQVESLTINHDGLDSIQLDWIRILLDDSTYIQCNDGQDMDGDEAHTLECGPYAP